MQQLPPLDTKDVDRIQSGLRERVRRLKRGIEKFGDDFDAEKGRNMTEALASHERLMNLIEKETENVD